jgi:hypothetical protein
MVPTSPKRRATSPRAFAFAGVLVPGGIMLELVEGEPRMHGAMPLMRSFVAPTADVELVDNWIESHCSRRPRRRLTWRWRNS